MARMLENDDASAVAKRPRPPSQQLSDFCCHQPVLLFRLLSHRLSTRPGMK